MHVIAVGKAYDPDVQEWPEGCHYNFDQSGHWLTYFYRNPTQAEIRSIQSGPAQFGIFVHDPVIFLLHQFGDMPWNDAPYSWRLVSAERRTLPETGQGLHGFLKVALVDTSTGLVAALRALTFSVEFTDRLHGEIQRQAVSPWDPQTHDRVINRIYERFTTEHLVRYAEILCKGGE